MPKFSRKLVAATGFGALVAGIVFVMGGIVNSQPPGSRDAAAEATPPAGQTYVGVKRCGSCHFKELMSWKKTKHATDAWEKVPAKYRAAAECVVCHSTGYGEATGFKDESSTANLAGTTCEACHGPGSKHAEACKAFTTKKILSPEEQKIARGSIYKIQPRNVCVACHTMQGHKDHPKYDQQ
jgi:mono/diheme cytochrome c family protein